MFKRSKSFIKKHSNKLAVAVAGVSAMLAGAAPARAEGLTVDYAAMVTAITAQLTPALTAALGVAGIILGVKYGYRFFKSFAKG